MDYLSKLNPEQMAPVVDTDGAVLVLAGAGSGKTRVLTSRIAYLIDKKGVMPYNILAITFTNKAANEMRERLEGMVKGASDIWVSTIHSMCVRILRSFIDRLGTYQTNFTIYSEADKERVLKRIITDLKITSESALKNAKYHISNAKNQNLSPEEYLREHSRVSDIERYVAIYRIYNEELKRSNSLDFDDLLLLTYELLTKKPEVLDYYANKFHYVHVDEFQDTNKIQCDIIKLLASVHKNIFVVGDDDQSIYGWRGAEIKNILNFHKDFKDAKVYKLEQNYRSTKRILDLANSIIKNNGVRSQKELWTENEQGAKIDTFFADEETGEAAYTAMRIRSLVQNGASYSDFAVLMRINALSRAYEQEFLKYGIPFKVFGGFKFFERKEIKDLTAYLRVLSNPLDNEAVLRIINVPKRGIGDKSIETLVKYAKDNGFMLFDSIVDAEKLDLPSGAKAKIVQFKKLIISLMADKETMTLVELLDSVIKKSDFMSQFDPKKDEDNNKMMNVGELKSSVDEFSKLNPNSGLNEYLSSITLSSDLDEVEGTNFVTIATIHSVKGLEFENVFIAGLDETIFPVARAVGEVDDMEEERRLMYVAITRARQRLFITRARSRFVYGKRQATSPSRFLLELSDKLGLKTRSEQIERAENKERQYDYEQRRTDEPDPSKSYGVASNFSRSFSRPKKASTVDVSKFKPGKKVRHIKFGIGTIIAVKSSNGNPICDVAFPGLGVKSFAILMAPMEVID